MNICDNNEVVDLEEFKKYILNCIREKINKYYKDLTENDDRYLKDVYNNIEKDIKELEKKKMLIEDEIEIKNNILIQLYTDKVEGNISQEEFNTIKIGNKVEIEKLKNNLFDINKKVADLISEKAKQIDKVQIFERYKDIKELNRVILDSFKNKIEISKAESKNENRPIKIDWKLYAK